MRASLTDGWGARPEILLRPIAYASGRELAGERRATRRHRPPSRDDRLLVEQATVLGRGSPDRPPCPGPFAGDARVLTREMLAHGPTHAALLAYEAERRPATSDLVMLNRRNGPEQVMQLVEERAPDGYEIVTDVLSLQELEDIAANYKRVAGFQVEGLNAKPRIVTTPAKAPRASAV